MKDLAEKLQDVFENAYESNQPFATREENVDFIFNHLNDADYVGLILGSLEEIRDEYSIDEDEVNLLLFKLGRVQRENLKHTAEGFEYEMGNNLPVEEDFHYLDQIIEDIWYDVCVNGNTVNDVIEKYNTVYHFLKEEAEKIKEILQQREKEDEEDFANQ